MKIDSRYVPSKSPGRVRIGPARINAAWELDTDTNSAVLTSSTQMPLPQALITGNQVAVSFYRGARLIVSGWAILWREERLGPRHSATLRLTNFKIHVENP